MENILICNLSVYDINNPLFVMIAMEDLNNKNNPSALVILEIKQTLKRTRQLAAIGLAFASFSLIVRIIFQLYTSIYLLIILICITGITLWFNYRGYIKYTKPIILLSMMILIAIIVFAEGLTNGGYMFFLPLLFALPPLSESKSGYKKELILYFFADFLVFMICVLFAPQKSTWQSFSAEASRNLFLSNTTSVVLLSIIFVSLIYNYERKYAKALVKQIDKAEKAMHARTRFLSNMGHELRTPLNGITGLVNLLQKEQLNAEQQNYLKLINYCSDQMLALVNNLLDLNKIESGKIELHPVKFNLKLSLEQSILPFYYRFDAKKLPLKITVDEKLNEYVLADDLRLIQVINNLLSNALKFTHHGQVMVIAECIDKQPQTLLLKVSVKDTGIGINKEDQSKIFHSFEQVINENTRKHQGTGLGLTISQKLLKLMGSMLQVDSEQGKGSTFFFTLPIARCTPPAPALAPALHEKSLYGIKILVAEDNAINLMIVKKMLESWQAKVISATNGIKALEALEAANDFHVVLLDLQMPEMDGYEAINFIKVRYPHLPVLAFSASLIDHVMKQALIQSGFIDYASKPFEPADLFEKIKKYSLASISNEQQQIVNHH